jgi:hypothetical protein
MPEHDVDLTHPVLVHAEWSAHVPVCDPLNPGRFTRLPARRLGRAADWSNIYRNGRTKAVSLARIDSTSRLRTMLRQSAPAARARTGTSWLQVLLCGHNHSGARGPRASISPGATWLSV